MKKIVFALAVIAIAGGCQQVSKVEYYEPTEKNAAYCTPRTEEKQGHGPVKSVEGKSGSIDWSETTNFKLNLSVLGL